MKRKDFLYIANWKNYFTYLQGQDWIKNYKEPLATLAKNNTLVICPSFESLSTLAWHIKDTSIKLGAQNCSAHNTGAFTGQVLIESLKELNCSYCIIGHPEVQRTCPEGFQELAKKAALLLKAGITPLVCFGETPQEYELSRGSDTLRLALETFCDALPSTEHATNTIGIAYEPLWAINAATIPPRNYIEKQVNLAKQLCANSAPRYKFLFLYGGGVDETSIREFKNIEALDGFLIGRASTDFQKLQKIVG